MRNLAVLFIHFIAILARLLGPGGVRSLIAESLLLKHQLLIVNLFLGKFRLADQTATMSISSNGGDLDKGSSINGRSVSGQLSKENHETAVKT